MLPTRAQICGLILSGGEGRRMGGLDKGWVEFEGRPLIEHVLARLLPQVAGVTVSANRNLERYGGLGVDVCTDAGPEGAFPGPLAGIVAGLERTRSAWLLVVPCDAPRLPENLAESLAAGRGSCPAAVACIGARIEPLFCLLARDVAPSARDALRSGERSVERWLVSLNAAQVPFPDGRAFLNVNSTEELSRAAN